MLLSRKKAQWLLDQNLDGFRPDDFLRLEARTSSGLAVTFEIMGVVILLPT